MREVPYIPGMTMGRREKKTLHPDRKYFHAVLLAVCEYIALVCDMHVRTQYLVDLSNSASTRYQTRPGGSPSRCRAPARSHRTCAARIRAAVSGRQMGEEWGGESDFPYERTQDP
jgi:hypothetical protein